MSDIRLFETVAATAVLFMGAADALINGRLRDLTGRPSWTREERPLRFWTITLGEFAGTLFGLFRIYKHFSGQDF